MNYEIVTTEYFDRKVKVLAKKYRSLPEDLATFKKELLKNPTIPLYFFRKNLSVCV